MGFAYSNAAGRVIDAIDREIQAQNPNGCSNEWRDAKGARYFYEIARKDQPDGGLRGTIHKFEGETSMARRVGRFQITGDGRMLGAPAHFCALLEAGAGKRLAALDARGIGARMGVW